MTNFNFEKIVIKLILFAGAALAIIQFFYNRSLWLDESVLALNIIHKSHFELLKPLNYTQVAPILFLQIEKIFSELIPNSEFGLRLFPLISYLLSLSLFYKIIKKIHQNYYTIIFSLSLFVFNATLFYYSSEVKQYMSDVLVLTSVYYFILKDYKNPKYKYYYLGIIGAIIIFLSNVAPIILFTAGIYLLYEYLRYEKKYFLNLTVISVVWASSFLLYYFLFIHSHPSRNIMLAIWSSAFMPANPLDIKFYYFLFEKANMIVHSLFQFGRYSGIILSVLILTGIISLIRKRRMDIIILTVTPLILHLILSGIKLYPFDTRLILYTCPCIIIICSFGFDYLVNILFSDLKIERLRFLAVFIPLIFLYYLVNYKRGFPIDKIEIKKSIEYMEQNISKGDKVFVDNFAWFPLQFYKEIAFVKTDTNNIIRERSSNFGATFDTISYSHELEKLSGRIWFLYAWYEEDDKRMNFLKKYYGSKGINAVSEFHTSCSDIYLYDIGNIKAEDSLEKPKAIDIL